MPLFTAENGKTYRYADCTSDGPDGVAYCYDPECPNGKVITDYLARWENVGDCNDGKSCDANILTCADHEPGFEEAKEAFKRIQKTRSAAYLTRKECSR